MDDPAGATPAPRPPRPPRRRLLAARLSMLGVLGPGLISANAGNDAGGIATYASVGAGHGYSLLWALALITVSLAIVQEMAGRLGAVTGKGYADVVRETFGLRTTMFIILALLVANGGLVVSEFAAIGAASELFGIPRFFVVPPMAFVLWWLITRGSYGRVERVFLAMTFVFFAYPAAALLARPDWGDVGRHLVRPSLHLDAGYVTLFIAMVGTTITPYMQIYMQSAVAERGRRIDTAEVRLDAYGGSLFANLIAGFIIVATGATLFATGQTVDTAAHAAQALGPLAGRYATYIFGAGLFGASMLAAGVLPLATSYTVTEAFGLEKGQTKSFQEAPVFLGLFTGLIALGAAIALLPINVIELLISMQVLNGLLLPVVLVSLLRLTNDPELMGEYRNGRVVNLIAWLTVGFVVALSTTYLAITLLGLVGVGPGA